MAHFVELDGNNIVLRVIVVDNSVLLDGDGNESEEIGIDFCNTLLGNGVWKQTSYNNTFRGTYATVGGSYDPSNNVFIDIKPFNSWVLNSSFKWESPIGNQPDDEKKYIWDEETLSWAEFTGT
jgi:hypothetical protein